MIFKKIANLLKILSVLTIAVLLHANTAYAIFEDSPDVESFRDNYANYEQSCVTTGEGGASFGGDVDKFLQVLAQQESGGDIKAISPTGARGKYQYIDSTWEASAKSYYPPALTGTKDGNRYRADLASEEVQDAVAYLEYSKKFKDFDNDISKLAISHFYPAANNNEALLDQYPPGNVITPRQYAEDIIDKMNSDGPWDNIPLKYTSAPEFAKYAQEAGIDLTSPEATGGIEYQAVGNIPAEGKEVGAELYGGEFKDGEWQPTDEEYLSSYDLPLDGSPAFAELGNELGGLEKGTKVEIEYNGVKVIVAKGDERAKEGSDIDGKPRSTGIWWQVAELLDFKNDDVIKIRGVAPDTGLSVVGGGKQDEPTLSASCNQECNVSSGAVVLDPGHSNINKQGQEKDRQTGIFTGDSNNTPEKDDMWETSQKVTEILEADDYTVINTRDQNNDGQPDDYTNLKRRAEIANNANAAIAVSIHYDGKHDFSSDAMRWVTPQETGKFRTGTNERKVFQNNEVAEKSQEYAANFVEERSKAEPGQAQIHELVFDGREGLSPGNISVVQLFATVPWVYNEVGGKNFNADVYAEGLANAIKKSVEPTSDSAGGEGCVGPVAGEIAETAENFAWEYGDPRIDSGPPREGYAEAIRDFNLPFSHGKDCGVFVAAVMIASGADPDYPKSGTWIQEDHVNDSGKYDVKDIGRGSTNLDPGDIIIGRKAGTSGAGAAGHTFIWLGDRGEDKDGKQKKGNIADASLGNRVGGIQDVWWGSDMQWIRARLIKQGD